MKTEIFTLLVVVASLHCWADPPLAEPHVVIGQPSIFWHNGEWQTYNDGVWTPYGQRVASHPARPHNKEGAAYSSPGIPDPGIGRNAGRGKATNLRGGSNAGIGSTAIGIGQPNGIGQSTGAIGEPNLGIGRTTIGIGKPNGGIGQPNGIGQTTIGIGKPNVSIGRTTTGMGQPNIGIGQPNAIGQTTIGIGRPASFPNQQRSSPLDTTK